MLGIWPYMTFEEAITIQAQAGILPEAQAMVQAVTFSSMILEEITEYFLGAQAELAEGPLTRVHYFLALVKECLSHLDQLRAS